MKKLQAIPRSIALACTLAAAGAVMPLAAHAGAVSVFVGYADSLRPSPFFPNPYDTADIFQGNMGSLDTGAVRIQNTGATSISLNDLMVTLNPSSTPVNFKLWNFGAGVGNASAVGLTLMPGQNAVFASTANYNFDTSDFGILGAFASNINNCSVGPVSAFPVCTTNAPKVDITIDNLLLSLTDTAHVLDTGGFDFVNANPCPVQGDVPGACNESLQWRLIGTTGINDPGGEPLPTPEPSSIALTLLGLAALSRRKQAAAALAA